MTLEELITIASSGYPDDFIRVAYWNSKTKKVRFKIGLGDTLALFIAKELEETYDPEASDSAQIEGAMRAMNRAREDVRQVILKLEEGLQ